MRTQRMGICTGPTGADLIDAWRHAHGGDPHAVTSPLAVAIQGSRSLITPVTEKPFPSQRYRFPFESGYACQNIEAARRQGTCDARVVEAAYGPDNYAATFRMYLEFAGARALCTGPRAVSLRDQAGQIESKLSGNNPLSFFKRRIDQLCPPRTRPREDVPPCREVVVHDPSAFKKAVHEQFDSSLNRAQPMEIGYCLDVLYERDAPSAIEKNDGRKPQIKFDLCRGHEPDDPEDDGGHSSVLIGRRKKGSECQLLIKNSYGTKCDGYTESNDCEDGKIWVSEDALARNVTGFSVLAEASTARRPPTSRGADRQ